MKKQEKFDFVPANATEKRILVFSVPSWNSKVGADTWASLLSDYDSRNIANVFFRDEIPDSDVCGRYFLVSENRIIKSIFKRNIKTGREISHQETRENRTCGSDDLLKHNTRYRKMQKKRRYFFLLLRELIWKIGRWKTPELKAFLDDFQPDIILHSMEGYIHLNRIAQFAIKRTGARAIGYIWDDNFTYKQSSAAGYKIYRCFQRRSLKKLAKQTSSFFAITEKTKTEADAFFGIDCKVLTKPLNSMPVVLYEKIEFPLRILYTGNLLIGRDFAILQFVRALHEINKHETKFFLDIYTQTELDTEKQLMFNDSFVFWHKPITKEEVLKKQRNADILLFLESIDDKHSRIARLSFSTKTTDYLSSGKCIFAVGAADTAPIEYLLGHKAAIVAESAEEIKLALKRIIKEPHIIVGYADRAASLGMKNHNPEQIKRIFREMLY